MKELKKPKQNNNQPNPQNPTKQTHNPDKTNKNPTNTRYKEFWLPHLLLHFKVSLKGSILYNRSVPL